MYFQNFYEQNLYRKALEDGNFPIFRGMKLSADDKLRRHIIKTIRTYFELNFSEIEEKFKINFNEYFSKEIDGLSEFKKDNLVNISKNQIQVTSLGTNFSPQIANIFDKYNPQKIWINKN